MKAPLNITCLAQLLYQQLVGGQEGHLERKRPQGQVGTCYLDLAVNSCKVQEATWSDLWLLLCILKLYIVKQILVVSTQGIV